MSNQGVAPRSFAEAIKCFASYREAGEWLGVPRAAAESMFRNDWVPPKYWDDLARGLECSGWPVGCDALEAWAEARGKWSRPIKKPADWSNLPEIERRIARMMNRRFRRPDMADDAASEAVLAMMECGSTSFGFAVVVAQNYMMKNGARASRSVSYHDDADAQAAMDLKMATPPNHEPALMVRDVFRAASKLPRKFWAVFAAMVREEDDEALGERLGVNVRSLRGYRAHVRRLLFAYMEGGDGAMETEIATKTVRGTVKKPGRRVLSDEQVEAIRKAHVPGSVESGGRALARLYGVNLAVVQRALKAA